jgi:NAD(P)-dependent dehydrogenase (short-subunit alcohol dehydrogenase family)
MEKLKNKFAFISGGTSGIGLATAKDFIQNGARVIISGRHQHTVDETVAKLGPRAYGIVCNHANMADIQQLGDRISAITTKIDILFVNAGYGKLAPIASITEEMYDELFNVLTKGSFFTVQQLLPLLHDGGAIIFNTSVVTAYGSQNAAVYSAAKAAVQSFIKTFAAELTSKNIRVNGVSPGYRTYCR